MATPTKADLAREVDELKGKLQGFADMAEKARAEAVESFEKGKAQAAKDVASVGWWKRHWGIIPLAIVSFGLGGMIL